MSYEQQIKEMMDKEVERRVAEELKKISVTNDVIIERFYGVFEKLKEIEQYELLSTLIGYDDEYLCDTFKEGKHYMSSKEKRRVSLQMLLETYIDHLEE